METGAIAARKAVAQFAQMFAAGEPIPPDLIRTVQGVLADSEADIPTELVVSLREPITLGDLPYTELKLREPTAAQVAMWDKLSGTEADILAVSVVSGVPKTVIEKLKIRDLNAASGYIARFFG